MYILEDVNKVLTPLGSLTDMLSEENYVTASSVLPVIEHLQDIVCTPVATDSLRGNEIRIELAHILFLLIFK